MFVVLAGFPKSGMGYIIDFALVGNPNLFLILTISKRQLSLGISFQWLLFSSGIKGMIAQNGIEKLCRPHI